MSILTEIKYLRKLIEIYRNYIVDIMDFNGYSRDFIANKLNELEERAKECIDNERR